MIYTKSTQTLYAHVWAWYTVDELISFMENHKPIRFILDCSSEYEPPGSFNNKKELVKLNQYIKTNSIESYIILGSCNIHTYPAHKKPLDILPDFNFLTYPLTFCGIVYNTLPYTNEYNKPTHLFYALINRPHTHRCILVDEIVNKRLSEYGKFTWNKLTEGKYNFKHWHEKIIIQKGEWLEDDAYSKPELQYFTSVFDLVVETTIETAFFTEKTFKPILLGKPFLIFGAPKISTSLAELGFQLYDEVIDYSFDQIEGTEERAKALCLELKRIALRYSLEEILLILKNKVEFNRKLAITLAQDPSHTAITMVNNYVKGFY